MLWEAQFGDFANGAQVVIDQFLSSSEAKWGRFCGLVMLLPHGYEGQGPEHSSARLERYLQLCAEDNIQVLCNIDPRADVPHAASSDVTPFRKPLIVMSPKSLLRHRLCVSDMSDLAGGSFQILIDDIDQPKPARIKRLVLCTGKVYYDLLEKKREEDVQDTAIVRVEQLYPFPRGHPRHIGSLLRGGRSCLVSGRAAKPRHLVLYAVPPSLGRHGRRPNTNLRG